MKTWIIFIASTLLLTVMPSRFPQGLSLEELAMKDAEAYYGSYSAGNVRSTGRATTRGTATIGGEYVTYYTAIPGNCIHLVSAGVSYYNCDGDYFRPYYLGNQIVYVEESP